MVYIHASVCGYVRECWRWVESHRRLSRPNSGLLQELYMPLTAESPLQLWYVIFISHTVCALYAHVCIVCTCVRLCVHTHVRMSEVIGQLMGVGSLLPSSNSCDKTWRQSPLPSEPSCRPSGYLESSNSSPIQKERTNGKSQFPSDLMSSGGL